MSAKEQLILLQKRAPFLVHTDPIAKDPYILLLELILFVQSIFMFKVCRAIILILLLIFVVKFL